MAEFSVAGEALERQTQRCPGGASLSEEICAGHKVFKFLGRLKLLRPECGENSPGCLWSILAGQDERQTRLDPRGTRRRRCDGGACARELQAFTKLSVGFGQFPVLEVGIAQDKVDGRVLRRQFHSFPVLFDPRVQESLCCVTVALQLMAIRGCCRSGHDAVVTPRRQVQGELACLVVAVGPRGVERQSPEDRPKGLPETIEIGSGLRPKVPGIGVARIGGDRPIEISKRPFVMMELQLAGAGDVPGREEPGIERPSALSRTQGPFAMLAHRLDGSQVTP